jgi:tetratricopeptide (TPR) repeat protein
MLADVPASDSRDARVAALEAETPPPAPELALLFRQLCASLARERPLVVVLDDVHWAEPTLLELVEALADRGEGPLTLICLARDELAQEHPDFLAGRDDVVRIELDTLSPDEADALLDGLGGTILESDQRVRIAETAEGNPFFVEQLLALAVEGGLREGALPPTVQALLAARLDRLGPGERAVLERGAVIGRDFAAADVTSLLDAEAVPTADAHLRSLSDRGFVRPRADGAFSFRHVLVQDAVYRAAPKRLRAELHERFADRLDDEHTELPELDEFVGYHLEQAYWLLTELGGADRRTDALAEDTGRRLGAAGLRAAKRGDIPAAGSLLRRATQVPLASESHAELLVELGSMLRAAGDLEGAEDAIERATDLAERVGARKVELRARMEGAYVRNTRTSATADELLDAATTAIPAFEAADDQRLLGRAWLLAGWVQGGHLGRHRARLDAAEKAIGHYARSTWPVSVAAGEIAGALYFGPTAVGEAIVRCAALLDAGNLDRWGRANVEAFMGGLLAQDGDFARGRALVASSAVTYEELGQRDYAMMTCGLIRAELELLAGDASAADEHFDWLCNELREAQFFSHLATAAGGRAESLYRLEQFDLAAEWIEVAESHSASDDLDALVLWMPVRAKCVARTGALDEAVTIANRALELAATTDALNRHAKALSDLGEIHTRAGNAEGATASYRAALELYEAKGNVAGRDQIRALLGEAALV